MSTLGDTLKTPPANLSALYLSGNRFSMLPESDLIRMKSTLRFVDVGDNLLREISPSMVQLLENQTDIIFNGK